MPAFMHAAHTGVLVRVSFSQCLLLKTKEDSSSQIDRLWLSISAVFSKYFMCVPGFHVSSWQGAQQYRLLKLCFQPFSFAKATAVSWYCPWKLSACLMTMAFQRRAIEIEVLHLNRLSLKAFSEELWTLELVSTAWGCTVCWGWAWRCHFGKDGKTKKRPDTPRAVNWKIIISGYGQECLFFQASTTLESGRAEMLGFWGKVEKIAFPKSEVEGREQEIGGLQSTGEKV